MHYPTYFKCIHNKKFMKQPIDDCKVTFSSTLKSLAHSLNQIFKDIQGQTFKAQSRPMHVSMGASHSGLHKQNLPIQNGLERNFCTQTRLHMHFLYSPINSGGVGGRVKCKCSPLISKSVFCIKYKTISVTDVQIERI